MKISKEDKPKVSVCMITYGHEKYIREAIEGVLMQECDFEVELIVANDCSPDGTDQIIRELMENHHRGSWIRYHNHPQNLGMMPNFIFALKECRGQYIALCEGDDYWTDSQKLMKQVEFLDNNKDYVLSFHPIQIIKVDGEFVDDFITKVPENYESLHTLAQKGNYIHTPSVVYRNIIQDYPFEFQLSPVGDYFLYIMLAANGNLKCLEDKMAVYRFGVGIHSGSSNIKIAENNIKFYSCILSYLKDDTVKGFMLRRQLQAISNLQRKGQFVSNHKFFRAIQYITKNNFNPRLVLGKASNYFSSIISNS
ncbi:MAG: glycosyltransferase family 2 protein [Flavobacterium sp.]